MASLIITILIILLRVVVYMITGSIAVLADVIHSSSDLTANIIAITALAFSMRKPDEEHPYGHGKAEGIGSFSISLLLLFLASLIIMQALSRMISGSVEVEFTFYSVLLLIITLALDLWRSKALERGGLRYGSMILRADALHYKSDFYITSSVLAVGLVDLIYRNESLILILDSAISIGIAGYIILASYRMMRLSLDELMDRSQKELADLFIEVSESLGARVRSVRSRRAGRKIFIDAVILLPEDLKIDKAHEITDEIEKNIRRRIREEVDIVIHVEPENRSLEERSY
ncbi:MAG: cation diffusion facilitator family transporter [Sulfolobales archaeon]